MLEKLMENFSKVIVGKKGAVEKLLICLLCNGHLLIEDVPGVGKTTIVKTMAKSIGGSFNRIQFTPDLLPTDILGINVYDKQNENFKFIKGPIHNNIILADEINRTSPKTQSSLLEVMQENQATIDGVTYKLEEPFLVIATQNPIEYEGTFPLPEAQLDRFLMKISLGYPTKEEELEIISVGDINNSLDDLNSIIEKDDIKKAKEEVKNIYIKDILKDYIVDIVHKTRNDNRILLGASPRATIALFNSVKALAYIKDRSYVIPRDIKTLALDVLSHRIILKPEAKYKGYTNRTVIEEITGSIRTPLVNWNE